MDIVSERTRFGFARVAPVAAALLCTAMLAACATEPPRPAPVVVAPQPAPAPPPAPVMVPRARG